MPIEIIVPRLGWSMDEGTFSRWLKQDGELVREGDELFELEGDKATQVVESFDAGILRIAPNGPQPGDTVKNRRNVWLFASPDPRWAGRKPRVANRAGRHIDTFCGRQTSMTSVPSGQKSAFQ